MRKRWVMLVSTMALLLDPLGAIVSDRTTDRRGATQAAIAAEYQGHNIDGQTFAATAYSYETGGLFDIQVQFNERRATMTFAGGSQQTIRLNRPVIRDPSRIFGRSRGLISIGGLLNIDLIESRVDNIQPSRPQPFEGLWRISLPEGWQPSSPPLSSAQ